MYKRQDEGREEERGDALEEAAAEDLDEPEFEEETVVIESETPQELRSMSFNQ